MDTIFVGIKGTVVAIDRSTGKTLWKTDLKGADFVNVTLQDGDLLAACRGRCIASIRRRARCNGATSCQDSATES